MKHLLRFLIVLIGCINLIGCNTKENKVNAPVESLESYIVVADTIITDVVIKNPGDDEWTDFCLRTLDKKVLVDNLFKAVYSGKLAPHEFFSDTVITIQDVKAIEDDPEFSREKIAKVQFEEKWYYNEESNSMIKKVHSIMLAYEIYYSTGEFKGYKPAFKVYLNN